MADLGAKPFDCTMKLANNRVLVLTPVGAKEFIPSNDKRLSTPKAAESQREDMSIGNVRGFYHVVCCDVQTCDCGSKPQRLESGPLSGPIINRGAIREGEDFHVRKGAWVFNPAGDGHGMAALGKRLRKAMIAVFDPTQRLRVDAVVNQEKPHEAVSAARVLHVGRKVLAPLSRIRLQPGVGEIGWAECQRWPDLF